MEGVKEAIVTELHKPTRKNYPRRKTILKGIDDLWQIDLVEVQPLARFNRGFKYLLTVIDGFSKYAWVEPVKNKTGQSVSTALNNIFKKSSRSPKNIQSDNGKEFYNSFFQNLMKKRGINHYSTYTTKKAAIVERFNRTLKTMMWRTFSLRGNYKYLDILPNILEKYNHSVHMTTGYRPTDVKSSQDEKIITDKLYSSTNIINIKKPKYKAGDFVRISKHKSIFAKGYTPNWSAEIFKIVKVNKTRPVTYILDDMKGQPILGSFYEQEINKTKHPNVYLVEKVLKKKGDKLYVKWLGLNEKSWIRKNDVI